MLKVEKVQAFLNCALCTELLDKPIFLPCGQIICNKHLDEMLHDKNSTLNSFKKRIRCSLCFNEHFEQFQVALSIQNMLEMNFNQVHSVKFNSCKIAVNELNEELAGSESILANPENYIFEYFACIKNRVNLQRETMKEKIDSYYEKVLEDISLAENNCREIVNENFEENFTEINEHRTELNQLMKDFDSNEINEAKYDLIQKKTIVLKPKFASLAEQVNKKIFNGKCYEFNPAGLNIEDSFGRFVTFRVSSSLLVAKNSFASLTCF